MSVPELMNVSKKIARAVVAAAIFGVMCVPNVHALNDSVEKISSAEFEQKVIAGSHQRVVVLDFYADWCSACKQMAPDLQAIAAKHQGNVSVVQVDGDEATALAERFDVTGFPVLIAFSEGMMVDLLRGLKTREALSQWFEILAGTSEMTVSSVVQE